MLLLLLSAPAAAQQGRTLDRAAAFTKDPGGVVLADVRAGTPVRAGRERDGAVEVTLAGWVFSRSLDRVRRDGFDAQVTAAGENLRAEPDGPVLARLRGGALVSRREGRGGWSRVERTGWVPRSALGEVAVASQGASAAQQPAGGGKAAGSAPAAAPAPAQPAPAPGGPDAVEVAQAAPLYLQPDAGEFAQLGPGARGRVLARSGDWVRVQVEGWVRAADLKPTPEGVAIGVSAAEVRADPQKWVGQPLEWRLQVISVQVADELRPEMPAGTPYLLTRGPLPEPGFVYVMIPRDQVDRFKALPPLAELTVRGTVRAARSRYLATPVLELERVVEPAGR